MNECMYVIKYEYKHKKEDFSMAFTIAQLRSGLPKSNQARICRYEINLIHGKMDGLKTFETMTTFQFFNT